MWNSPPDCDNKLQALVNEQLEIQNSRNPSSFPNLRIDDDLVLACDYSGEHKASRYQILTFLLADRRGILKSWDIRRRQIRSKYLSDGRKHEFKKLGDAQRQKALGPFLKVSSEINGIVFSVAFDKELENSMLGFSFPDIPKIKPKILAKLVRIAFFGSTLVAGLAREGQELKWITDNDEIVSNAKVQSVATFMISSMLNHCCSFKLSRNSSIGIAGEFDDDFRAEDLCSIPDLAGGAMTELLNSIRKDTIPKSEKLYTPSSGRNSTKTTILASWFADVNVPLRKLFCLVRPDVHHGIRVSFGNPEVRIGNTYTGQVWLPPDKGWTRNWRNG